MTKKSLLNKVALLFLALPLLVACTSSVITKEKTLIPQETKAATTAYYGKKTKVALGQFENRTNYMRGVFSNGGDTLGTQARTILKTHLQNSGRYSVLDRSNLDALSREAGFAGETTKITGAQYVITGDVVEFGRKNVGDQQLFGVLGKGKTQIAYAKVAVLFVDIKTSEVVFTAQGAGEVEISGREVFGFGSTTGYDSTLTGKVLNLAIRQAVDALVASNDQ